MHGLLACTIFVPLLGGLLLPLCSRSLGRRTGWVALVFPILAFCALIAAAMQAGPEGRLNGVLVEWPWIPSLGISLTFGIDGLSLLFGLIVSGVGIMVFFYALHYFEGNEPHLGRFYSYMVLFMTAMLGTVLADNLLLLFIFWEMTGITSFLLIGFLHTKEASRAGARAALLITMFTGLLMLVGIILLGQAAGTLSWSVMREAGLPMDPEGTLAASVLLLLMLGAFGKSAQFPFHFWLPRAMEAPTPVSAYLHSATMVKLGVFLAARLYPVFSEVPLWMPLLTLTGFGTMALAAYLALRSNSLKGILAYSTVTQLGCLIGLYGLQSRLGVFADTFHILDHVFYKAALFMVVGIITHATGCKDIRELGGLRQRMPVLAVVTGLACASMAGLPLTMGFVAKELLLADFVLLLTSGDAWVWTAFTLLAAASIFKLAFAIRFFTAIFTGPLPEAVAAKFHAPGRWVQAPPVLLVSASVLCGWVLMIPDHLVTLFASTGLQSREGHLSMWHGFNVELAMSLALICGGLCLFLFGRGTAWRWTHIPRLLRFDEAFEHMLKSFNAATQSITRALRSESPTDYLPVMLSTIVIILAGFLLHHLETGDGAVFLIDRWKFEPDLLRSFTTALIALAALGVVIATRWTSQIILLSAVGFLTTFLFVLYRAPDLALTQILVESATLLLVLLLLARFPKEAQKGEDGRVFSGLRSAFNLLLAVGVGSVVTTMILLANAAPPARKLGDAFLAQTIPLAEGTNAVNTILVDFRGFDTLGEIAVLVIAILGALGLFFRYKRSERQRAQRALGAPGFGIFHTQPKPEDLA